jgi:Ca-activated chloride channel family protein
MQTRALSLITLLIASLLTFSLTATVAAIKGWKTYTNPELGFSLQYPPVLTLQKGDPTAQAYTDQLTRWTLKGTEGDKFIFFKVINNPHGVTPEQWIAKEAEEDSMPMPDVSREKIGLQGDIPTIGTGGIFEGQLDDDVLFQDPKSGKLVRFSLIVRGIEGWTDPVWHREGKVYAQYKEIQMLFQAMQQTLRLAEAGASPAAGNGTVKALPAKTMFVYDSSGSMWGKVDGKAKVLIAREHMRILMKNWNPANQLGLSAYGHRRKGDCMDIETLIPVTKADPQAVVRALDGLKPRGRTPLTEAVRQAAEELKYEEDPATVILVTDGKETCDADPCALGKALEEASVDFKVDVIGFDVKRKDQAGLRCLAENTGGIFCPAFTAHDLGRCMKVAVKKAEKVEPGVIFEARLVEGGELIKTNQKWEVFRAGADDKPEGNPIAVKPGGNPVQFVLPAAGRYMVKFSYVHTINVNEIGHAGKVFEYRKDEAVKHTIILGAAKVALKTLLVEGGGLYQGSQKWEVHWADADGQPEKRPVAYSASGIGNPQYFWLPAGRYVAKTYYRVGSNQNPFGQAQLPFDVVAGKEAVHSLALDAGKVTLQAMVDKGVQKFTGYITWAIYRADANDQPHGTEYAYSIGSSRSFWLPAGRYVGQASPKGKQKVQMPFDVVAGKEQTYGVVVGRK